MPEIPRAQIRQILYTTRSAGQSRYRSTRETRLHFEVPSAVGSAARAITSLDRANNTMTKILY